jgi:hypothetical protein
MALAVRRSGQRRRQQRPIAIVIGTVLASPRVYHLALRPAKIFLHQTTEHLVQQTMASIQQQQKRAHHQAAVRMRQLNPTAARPLHLLLRLHLHLHLHH